MKNAVLNRGDVGPNMDNDSGTVISHGYNLCNDNCAGLLNGPGDQINTDPILGPLQNNGGPTLTHALLPGSPAIDAGVPNFTPPPFFDQRGPGFDRVVNGRIDKGSFEVQGPTPTPTPTATPCASAGAWTEQSPYPIAVSGNAVASQGGNVYSFGGIANNTAIANAYKYTPATNTWTPIAPLPAPRGWFSGASDGTYIYAGGGNASPDKTWRYDPNTDTWDDAAIADLPSVRSAAASGAYNGRWLLAGGDVNFAISDSAIAWDPATNTWNNLPNMVQARDYLGGATAGQSFYAVAGNSAPGTPTNDNQQYTETGCGTPSPTPTATPTA